MTKMDNAGIGKLARTLDRRMSEHQEGRFEPDFGLIQSDYSLVTDTFPVSIARADYSVCRSLSGISLAGGIHSGHNSGNGTHTHSLPRLNPGDRVLVIWVNGEAVVVDVILRGNSL